MVEVMRTIFESVVAINKVLASLWETVFVLNHFSV